MKALVTGGAGFLPSHVVDALLARGDEVVVLDDFSSGFESNLPAGASGLSIVRADVADAAAVEGAAKGCDAIFHLASDASVPASVADPRRDCEANVMGTLAVLEAARRVDARRVVFASSAAVYGAPVRLPMDEDHPTRPLSPYGATKLAAEHLARAWGSTYGVEATVLRVFNAYGPRQRRYVLHDLYRKMTRDPRDVEVLGTGEEVRDYVFVKDAARAIASAASHAAMGGRTFNVAGGSPTRVHDLARLLMAELGLNGGTRLRFTGASWPGDLPALVADVRRLRDVGLAPRTPLATGLRVTVRWFREHVRG